MAKFSYGIIGVVAMTIAIVSAVTEGERTAMRTASLPLLIACGPENGVTKDQVMAAKEAKNPDALNPCFYACFFKKAGIMTEKGVFDSDTMLEKHKKFLHDQADLDKITEVGKKCISVNDLIVGDGAKGCERAMLLVHCFLDQKTDFTPYSA